VGACGHWAPARWAKMEEFEADWGPARRLLLDSDSDSGILEAAPLGTPTSTPACGFWCAAGGNCCLLRPFCWREPFCCRGRKLRFCTVPWRPVCVRPPTEGVDSAGFRDRPGPGAVLDWWRVEGHLPRFLGGGPHDMAPVTMPHALMVYTPHTAEFEVCMEITGKMNCGIEWLRALARLCGVSARNKAGSAFSSVGWGRWLTVAQAQDILWHIQDRGHWAAQRFEIMVALPDGIWGLQGAACSLDEAHTPLALLLVAQWEDWFLVELDFAHARDRRVRRQPTWEPVGDFGGG